MELLNNIGQDIITTLIMTGILGYLMLWREEKLKSSIKEEFNKRDRFFNTQFDFKLRSIEELLGPIVMQFQRSLIALNEYSANNMYREAILKECNTIIRDLLLNKGHLIPSDLQEEAGELIKHYDGWLEEFHQIREVEKDATKAFVFTYDFPKEAEQKFTKRYQKYRDEVKLEKELD